MAAILTDLNKTLIAGLVLAVVLFLLYLSLCRHNLVVIKLLKMRW
jgi:Cu/Ag efflux pump CusA